MIATPPRHDLYAAVHKGLRRRLALLLIDLGSADWGNPREADRLRFAVAQQLVISHQHLHHEDVFVRPLIEAAGAAGAGEAGRIDDDHDAHRAAFARITALLEEMALAPAAAPLIGRKLYLAFADFVAEDLEHMGYEEQVVTPLLHACYGDDELHAVHQRILASLPPEEFLESLRFIVPALARDERAGMLGAMRADAPAEVFDMVMLALEPLLDPADWARLEADLGGWSEAAQAA